MTTVLRPDEGFSAEPSAGFLRPEASPAAVRAGEFGRQRAGLLDGLHVAPCLVAVHPGDRADRRGMPTVDLLQRVGDLPDGRLGAGGLDR